MVVGQRGFLLPQWVSAAVTATILAGGETDLPADTPSGRLDTAGDFSFVGALAISSGGGVLVAPYVDWIGKTTGIPEPSNMGMLLLCGLVMLRRSVRPKGC